MARAPNLEAWSAFARVSATGCFVRAAEDFGLSKATVSKPVARLERRPGMPLLHRPSCRLSLTDAGSRSVVIAQRIPDEAEAMGRQAMRRPPRRGVRAHDGADIVRTGLSRAHPAGVGAAPRRGALGDAGDGVSRGADGQ